MLPTVFLSHGAPTLVLEDIPARQFIAGLGATLPRPKAVLCVSAHWETVRPAVSGASSPETIHDFYGFPEALYRLQYPAPGAPALAKRVAELIDDKDVLVSESGINTREDVKKLADAGVRAVLVGESLMRSDDIAGKIRELFSNAV